MNIICPNCGKEKYEKNILQDISCDNCSTNLLLNKRYYLNKILGENKEITYLATDKHNYKVIIKELKIHTLKDWKNEELFKREINALKSINHKQIPSLIDSFNLEFGENNNFYLVMEFIDGISLEAENKMIKHTEEDVLLIIKELNEILSYLHNLDPPIIHRDIKPTNIMRRKDNKLILIDFGSVNDILNPKTGATIAGTFGFMAPEQFMGRATIQSDYYSLGMVALVLLTNQTVEQIEALSSIEFIRYLNINKKMKALLMKLLATNLDDRVKNNKELAELVRNYENLKLPKKIRSDYSRELFKKYQNYLLIYEDIVSKHDHFWVRLLRIFTDNSDCQLFANILIKRIDEEKEFVSVVLKHICKDKKIMLNLKNLDEGKVILYRRLIEVMEDE